MNSEANDDSETRDGMLPTPATFSNDFQDGISSVSLDDFELTMARIRSGDAKALGELIQNCRDYLLLIANRELDRDLNRKLGPSDIVQNTMVASHENVEAFQGDKHEQFMAWIRQILLNDLNRVRRRYKNAAKRDSRREKPMAGDSRMGQ